MIEKIVHEIMEHQAACGPFYEIAEDGKEYLECDKCGLKLSKGPDSPMIETEAYKLELF